MGSVAENGECKKRRAHPKIPRQFSTRRSRGSPGNQASGIDWIVQEMPEGKTMTQR